MRNAPLHSTGCLSLLLCWFVWSFILKRSYTWLDEQPGNSEGFPWWQFVRNCKVKMFIVLGMASEILFAKVVLICKEKRKMPPVLWACPSSSVCVSYSCSSAFLFLKPLTGEQSMHVSFYTALWGIHNPIWPCSSAFIMSLRQGIWTLSFCSLFRTFPLLPLSAFPSH